MNTIWLDVTTILGWHRPPVGIIRMEAGCARYALENLEFHVRFCRFERERGYFEVSERLVRDKLDEIASAGRQIDAGRSVQSAVIPVQIRTKAAFSQRLRTLIRLVLNNVDTFWRLAAGRPKKKAKPSKKKVETASEPKAQIPLTRPNLACPFSIGDVYVSLGLDWDNKDLVYLAELKDSKGLKIILCCYDIIPIKFPHLCVADVAAKFAHYFVDLAWCANEVLCISECSRRDLQELLKELGGPLPATTVITLGSNLPDADMVDADSPIKQAVGEKFILYVSTIERRKNHETLYRAYARLVEQGFKDPPKLVFVGMPGWGVGDLMKDLELDPRTKELIRILPKVDDVELAWLYRNSLFTVFPSLYEGWGLPVAESLVFGKFCLASDKASIPEVGGDLLEYVDPWDVPLWADRIRAYCEQPNLLVRAEARIRQDYVATSWADTGRIVFEQAATLRDAEKAIVVESRLPPTDPTRALASALGR